MELLPAIRKKTAGLIALAAGGLMAGGLLAMPAANATQTDSQGQGHQPVSFCHATGSETNPYVFITTDMNAFYEGHVAHQHAGDIYPGMTFEKGNKTITVVAQNWTTIVPGTDVTGADFVNAGCVAVVVTPPPTTEPPTSPPVTETVTQPPVTETVTQPPVTQTVTQPPVTHVVTQPPAAAPGQGAARPAPAQSVSLSAGTSAGATADYTVTGLLLGSGALLLAWLALTLWTKRARGRHM
jgi:hypothetical protein